MVSSKFEGLLNQSLYLTARKLFSVKKSCFVDAVPAGSIEMLFDGDNQPWLKQVDIGDLIGISNMSEATSRLSPEDKKSRVEITLGLTEVCGTKIQNKLTDYLNGAGSGKIIMCPW